MIECNYCLTYQNESDVVYGTCPNCGAPIAAELKNIRWCLNPLATNSFIQISHPGISAKEWDEKIKQRQQKIIYSQLGIIR